MSGVVLGLGLSQHIPDKKKPDNSLSFLDYETTCKLCMLLNPPDIFGNDWRMLADKMGFTFIEIRNIERESNPTQTLLLLYKTRTGKGTKQLLHDLHDYTLAMGREDCALLLKTTLDEDDGHASKINMVDLNCARASVLTEHIIEASEFYYGRLCCLLLKEGTKHLRNYFLQNLPKGTDNIYDFLRNDKYKFKIKLLREQKYLTQTQFNTLYPASCAPDPLDFDQSLLCVLIRNFSRKCKLINWGRQPLDHETEPEQDIIRLKQLRHRLIHKAKADMTKDEFEKLFNEITEILLRFGASTDEIQKYTDNFSTSDIPTLQQEYSKAVSQLKEQYLRTTMTSDFTPAKQFNRFMVIIIVSIVSLFVGIAIFVGIYLSKYEEFDCAGNEEMMINSDSGIFKYMSREGWNAKPAKGETPIHHPVPNVVIAHTAGLDCDETYDCCNSVIKSQDLHQNKFGWWDIGYNFLVGEDGVIYEGRGWNNEGSHTRKWNNKAIGIAFIGDFRWRLPNQIALTAAKELLHYGVVHDLLAANYTLYGHCQLRPFMSPGETLYNELMKWDHWRFRYVTDDELKLTDEANRTSYCVDIRPPRLLPTQTFKIT